MKVVILKHIPFKGFTSMMFYLWILVREDRKQYFNVYVKNHETIHAWQLLGVTIISLILLSVLAAFQVISWWWLFISPISYWILYVVLWLLEILLPPYSSAYSDSPFEREAKRNQVNLKYCSGFPPLFSWVKYILVNRL